MEEIQPKRDLPAELARALRAAREARGWSRVEVAREVQISRGHLENIEAGRRVPSAAVAADLARVLDLDDVTAEGLQAAAVPDRGKSSPYALARDRPHGRVTDWPTLVVWLRQQSTASPEQLTTFIATVDRRRLDRLDAELRNVARALRSFVRADDQLLQCEVAESVARALERLEQGA